ncbi:MAG: hypothetical protein KatS3mg105_1717 [Gemmatales bacterium]|nr:MAG: hypothetical protein KatS3mg105_1717 [Gemmatales bacterium]
MKRSIGLIAGMALVFGAASESKAQSSPQYSRGPVTRVALINLGQVFKNYKKFQNGQESIRQQQTAFEAEMNRLQSQATAKQNELRNPNTSAQRREQLEKELRDLKREMQDKVDEARKKVGQMQFDLLVKTYKEVQVAVERLARSRNIEMVLHYTDAIDEDAYLPQFFQRKMANGALQPMYIAPGLDITTDVYTMLNNHYVGRSATNTQPAIPPLPRR